MALLKKNTQASLGACQHDHTECEVRIAELHAARASALNDDADADVLIDFDRKIVAESAKLTALASKIEMLQIKLEREQSDRQRKEYARSVGRLESEVAALEAPAKEVASAFRSFATAVEKLAAAQSAFIRAHPPGFLLPGSRVSLARVQRAISAAFSGFEDRADRLAYIREVAGNFIEAELSDYADHIASLRADQPQSETEQEAA
jgi:hypothetical protein